jgi:hypothetical protein
MPRVKQASKTKHVSKAVPVMGAAGLTLSLVGGASAAAVPAADVQPMPNVAPGHEITLGEEEISDVSLATFYAFDKENIAAAEGRIQLARGGCHGCGGHGCGGRGCGGRGCGGRGCGGRGCGCLGGCGCGCGGCGCGCLSWGGCRLC